MRPLCCILAVILIAFAGSLPAEDESNRGATTTPGDPVESTVDARDQVTTTPFFIPSTPAYAPRPLPPLDGYVPTDSITSSIIVTAGDEYCVRFDADQASLGEELRPYTLTEDARAAIELAPSWLRMDLENNLRRLSDDQQDRYAALLAGVADPRIVDEVAFQIAHVSYYILGNPNWDETLMLINASLMYEIDPDLHYVEIVDYDLGDGDFYSTTSYQTIVDGDTIQIEIPREMYYFYVLMPVVSDEYPIMDSSVYDMFWREYLYYEHDDGYPLLAEVMQPITVLWDGERHDWPGGRPFTDTMPALDAVGNWCSETVPNAASGNRPIQPNQIAHEHNGNCGELQDLLCAAARTCLIPTVCTMDILEDHVWCEMWLDEWNPYQIDLGRGPTRIDNHGIAYDVDYGGGKEVSCIWDWRNDGFTWEVVGRYSETCTLTVYIDDPLGIPVDNAQILIASESYYAPYDLYIGVWGETGQDGTLRFILGNHQNYHVKVLNSLGTYPPLGYAQIITDSEAGEHYYWNWTTNGTMTQLAMSEDPPGSEAPYVIEVEYELPHDLRLGHDYWNSPHNYYAEKLPGGTLDFFIADQGNLAAYLAEEAFHACMIAEDVSSNHVFFHPPSLEDHFVVLSGAEHFGLATQADVTVRLWQHVTAAPPPAATLALLPPVPNPFNPRTRLSFHVPQDGPVSLAIYDLRGALQRRLVDESLTAGIHERIWDGRNDRGRTLASGVYLARLVSEQGTLRQKLVMLR